MTALATQQIPLECTINIVDTFTKNLEAMKARKKAARVTSIRESDTSHTADESSAKSASSLASGLAADARKERRRSRRMPRKTGNSSTQLPILTKDGAPGFHRSNTDPSVSLAERVSKLKKKSGCTVDPDEWLAERREAKRQAALAVEASASNINNSSLSRGGRRGMPRKTANSSSGNNLAAKGLPGLHRSSTVPTLSLQQRMEKLKEKQRDLPDPDDLLAKRSCSGKPLKKSTSKLFGSAPNLAGLAMEPQAREKRRQRRSTSRTHKTRISRTTSAGRLHDDKELPVLVSYNMATPVASLKRSCTDTGVYAGLVTNMDLNNQKGDIDAATSA